MKKDHDYRGLRLVGGKGERMAAAPQARPSVCHFERAGYIADIFVSSWADGEIYHYIIQPADSREIVQWGQETSLQRAKDCVNDFFSEQEKRQA